MVLIATLASVMATTSLGLWQLRRADFKAAMAQQVEQRQHDQPLRNADWPCRDPGLSSQLQHRAVVLQGHWLTDKVAYLDNRQMEGQAGFFVLTPLRLDPAPACGPAVVLVQRGWVPRNANDRQSLKPVLTEANRVEISGNLLPEVSQIYALGQEPDVHRGAASPLLRQNMSHSDWQAWLGQPLAPFALRQSDDPQAPSKELKRAWPAPDVGVGKHHAYAAQWFVMALIITGLYVWFQLIRPRRIA